jgi:hypothetical protein
MKEKRNFIIINQSITQFGLPSSLLPLFLNKRRKQKENKKRKKEKENKKRERKEKERKKRKRENLSSLLPNF